MIKPLRLLAILSLAYLLIGLSWSFFAFYMVDKTNSKTACTPENATYQRTKCTPELIKSPTSVCQAYQELCVDTQVNSPIWIFQTLKKPNFYIYLLTWPKIIGYYFGAILGISQSD